ncbi:uncharacterized protein LOC110885252 isoform X1 [Helianthus annuus]|uniref:uncharacterized protein LOC110885252 isoform X1 n=1 Tax=Helianthus annuus TaxID=4232 RepID=UPI000B8F15B8|nr:uncharacterized protein LOC110885252 isoform X1 [Helianthus annuus]
MTYPNCFEIIEPVVAPTYKTLKSMAANDRSLIELPNLNLEDVLSKLPLPSLIACCGVSKSLLNLIKNDSDFARMHFAKSEPQLMTQIQRHPGSSIYLIDLDTDTTSRVEVEPNFNIPLDGFYITQSCNGLLLLERMSKAKGVHRCMLYNPVTGECTLLPEIKHVYIDATFVFLYCPKTNQFEVVCLNPDSDVSSDSDHDPDTDSDPEVNSDSEMVYPEDDVMGAIYVTGSDSWESLGKLPFSPHHPCHLEKAVHWICVDEATKFNVWVMKEYGVKDSWSREFVIDTTVWGEYDLHWCFTPVICRNNGDVVMVSIFGYILFYDLLTKKGRIVNHRRLWTAMTHTPSLISLRDVVRGTNLEVVNVAPRVADPGLNLELAATFSEVGLQVGLLPADPTTLAWQINSSMKQIRFLIMVCQM